MADATPSLELSPKNDLASLRTQAYQTARACAWVAPAAPSRPRQIAKSNFSSLASLEKRLYALKSPEPNDDLKWLYENLRLVHSELQDLRTSIKSLQTLPTVRTATEDCIPRAIVLARDMLVAANYQLTEETFLTYLNAVQEIEYLRLNEIWGMLLALKLSLLELLAHRGNLAIDAYLKDGPSAQAFQVGSIIRSLRFIGQRDWRDLLESLSLVHRALTLDPSGVYSRMDPESRQAYLRQIGKIAPHSDMGELQLAQRVVKMAGENRLSGSPLNARAHHVGFFLFDERGRKVLNEEVNYRRPLTSVLQAIFRRFPDEVYIIGIEAVTLLTVVFLITSLFRSLGSAGVVVGGFLLLLPAAGAAVELINYLVTTVLTPHSLPKLDFSKTVDPACATMVAIPTLLINERQIRQLVEDLEVRYLVNRDPNIFYALLTDLPDTAEPSGDQDARIDLAIQLINELNTRHANQPYGGFYLFHRHRVYNPRENAWMGFERKRGKLLDLNQLLRNAYDPFPVKAGDMSRLPRIRYVITLDSDTQLPRGTAQKMIGAMAHPLNQPLVDPESNIVTRGYGILQPRVGISVQSATRSRLAGIYSGETGFDIYSRAVSDVYQDLYGEGIFTGKGIYDVDCLRQVLEHRFPRNALLSHDLIEGAYARAGLVSDIEVIDDYPSHYSAYNRRKHRWLRGDWQIVRWIFSRVPDETRKLVRNPITLVSRWKIIDNLRRSLMEPATFLLLVAGWYILPGGPRFWTIVTLALLFLPIYFRLLFAVVRAAVAQSRETLTLAFSDFFVSHVGIALNTAFLAHQAMVSVDAIVRTVIRSTITHRSLLEWETATEAELGIRKRTPVDVYLDWTPVLCLLLAIPLYFFRDAIPWAAPFLVIWACSKLISKWLNASPLEERPNLSDSQNRFIRETALRTWHYFEEFSSIENNWLVPDNVQLEPYCVANRLSPTNLGLLLNSRQAALELGYITLEEFVDLTEKTLTTILKLPRYSGHFVNWYDTTTLKPLEPLFISCVDNGNFIASLWSLKEGCRELLSRPILGAQLQAGIEDYCASEGKNSFPLPKDDNFPSWLSSFLSVSSEPTSEGLAKRFAALKSFAGSHAPWLLSDVSPELPGLELTPANSAEYFKRLGQFAECQARVSELATRLSTIIAKCEKLADQMDFSILVDHNRNLLSIGFDVAAGEPAKSCYDLLASEARIATFVAVAKGDVEQDTWFRLGRQHTMCEGETTLISWTGTMFEYLMPVIWMRSHPNTLLHRAVNAAVRAQKKYGRSHNVPWGISESAYSRRDEAGNYQYAAFGLPGLALNVARAGSLVVSPYSSCLALMVDSPAAIRNLQQMAAKHWIGEYGFYESADFTASVARTFRSREAELIRSWMAHHQGMSLTAICNLLCENPFQRWFHADRMVQASEMILQEKPLRVPAITDVQLKRVMPFVSATPLTAKA